MLDAQLRFLFEAHNLSDATEVLLAGGSAGGLAVYLHADYIRDTWFSAAMMRSEVCNYFILFYD